MFSSFGLLTQQQQRKQLLRRTKNLDQLSKATSQITQSSTTPKSVNYLNCSADPE